MNNNLSNNNKYLNNNSYNCTECSSPIEILSINEDKSMIEFRCLNEVSHGTKTMQIKEYLEKMEKFKKKNINNDKCELHSSSKDNKYVNFCFDCNLNLCNECLSTGKHINHNKINIIEIKPNQEKLNEKKKSIEDYNVRIDNIKKEKEKKVKELENLLENRKNIEKEKNKNKFNANKIKKEEELQQNKNQFLNDIKKIKKEFENKIKIRKNEFKKAIKEIDNKYKSINEKENILYKLKNEKLEKNINIKIKNLEYDKEIEKIDIIKKLNEVIYNTYISSQNNYYNLININNILPSDRRIKMSKEIESKIKEVNKLKDKNEEYKNEINKLREIIKKNNNDKINEQNENELKIKDLYNDYNKMKNKINELIEIIKDKNKENNNKTIKINESNEKIKNSEKEYENKKMENKDIQKESIVNNKKSIEKETINLKKTISIYYYIIFLIT